MIEINERVSVEYDEETKMWHGTITYHGGSHLFVEDNLEAIIDHMVDMGEATREEFRDGLKEFFGETFAMFKRITDYAGDY